MEREPLIFVGISDLAGIAFGAVSRWPAGRIAVRVAGAVIVVIGLGYLTGVI